MDKHGKVEEFEEFEDIDHEEEADKAKSSRPLATLTNSPEKEAESKTTGGFALFRKKKVRSWFEKILQVIEKLFYFLIGGELKYFFWEKYFFSL